MLAPNIDFLMNKIRLSKWIFLLPE